MKMAFSGRQPQNIKRVISQQPLDRSYSNLKLKLRGSSLSVQRYQKKTISKYNKWNISATIGWIVLKFETNAKWIKPKSVKVFKSGAQAKGTKPIYTKVLN